MESRARHKNPTVAHDPSNELRELLETMTRSVVGGSQAVTVFMAEGKGFIHFEIRCPKSDLSVLERYQSDLYVLMKVAGTARKTRITMQFHEQSVHEASDSQTADPSKTLEKLVLTMTRALADRPEEVVVFPADGDGFSHYDVRCESKDVGALIGSRGSHAGAMRNLLEEAGRSLGIRASLHIMGRDGNA